MRSFLMPSLFAVHNGPDELGTEDSSELQANPGFSQWFTPEWAAQALVERYFPGLSSSDFVVEPSCGAGAFLKAIPDEVPVVGVEIAPELARQNTGRHVITGDFATATLPSSVTAAIENRRHRSSGMARSSHVVR